MDNMQSPDVIELLDTLYGMVTEAWGVPLGNDKCIIERAKAIEIINDIKANLPTALAEAKRLVSARDEFIGTAKREAEAIRKTAEDNATRMIEEQEIYRAAKDKSAKMIAAAEEKVKVINRRCGEYVNSIMQDAESKLNGSISALTATREAFNNSFAPVAAAETAEEPEEDSEEV